MRLLVVNFHYLRDEKYVTGIYPRTMKEFIFQINTLSRFYNFISQTELIRCIENNDYPSGNYCLITFDDNLREQMQAFYYLKEQKIPALFFSTTMPYIENKIHFVHKTHLIFSSYSESELKKYFDKINGYNTYSFNEDTLNDEYRYDSVIIKKIKFFLNFVLHNDDKIKIIDRLFNLSINSSDTFINDLYMSKKSLIEISKAKMLGSHTHSHYPLSSLNESQIKYEINSSKKILEDITNSKIYSISYPYGGKGSINKKVFTCVRKANYKLGFTMNREINKIRDLNSPFMLNRIDTNDAPGGKLKSKKYEYN